MARLVALAALIAATIWLLHRTSVFSDPSRALATMRGWRSHAWLAPAFVVVYVLLTTVAFPGEALTFAGGALFGLALGSLLNWLGATIGACTAYAVARFVGGRAADSLLGRFEGTLRQLREPGRGFWTIFRLRLIPLVPFNALNVASGLVRVPFRGYLAATALGILPGTVIYTYFADAVLSGVAGARRRAFVNLATAAGLLLALSFLPRLAKRARGGRSRAWTRE